MSEGRPPLSRASLRRVVQSLLQAQRVAVRGERQARTDRLPTLWPDTLRLSDGDEPSLGCDSLEQLQLAAAANEMFHLHEGGDEANLLAEDTFGEWLDHIERAMQRSAPRVTFLTSGSTGLPKRCSHAVANLKLEAGALAQRFADRRRIVALVPAHHIYGFILTALLADTLGVEVWSAERAGPGELARGLRPGDLVISFPERWIWLERSLADWPPDVGGVTSTAPCPDGLGSALKARGLAGLVELYGSSETAGIAWRDRSADDYTLMPHWRFAPGMEGAHPALVHKTGFAAALPDHVEIVGDRTFRLAGRVDGAVQVGGVNIHPGRIARLLEGYPGVQTAAVRLMRTDYGARLKAFVVPEAGLDEDALATALSEWCVRHLSAPERPTAFTFGPQLPRSDLGKLTDW